MRCAKCGRWRLATRTRRGPDGRLLFDWCAECLATVELRALGLKPPEPEPEPVAVATRPRSEPTVARRERAFALRTIGLIMVSWGVILELVAGANLLGFRPANDGFGPAMTNRVGIFAISGAILAVLGLSLGLSSIERRIRTRWIATTIEVVAIGASLLILIVGIVDHRPRRDPWIVAGVGLLLLVAWAARRWARSRSQTAGSILIH